MMSIFIISILIMISYANTNIRHYLIIFRSINWIHQFHKNIFFVNHISLIPLSLIAFTIGGFLKVFYMFGAIIVIHAIKAYILNPKLMSSKTNLPVFYTFVVLIFSQHFFGVWGLIIGIPVFVFLLEILDVTIVDEEHV